jgi:hypothetical protein
METGWHKRNKSPKLPSRLMMTRKLSGVSPPVEARLIFVLESQPPGKNYRLAKMVTTASTPAQILYFRHERFSLFGSLKPDGIIAKIPPLTPPPPLPKQGQLF